LTGSSDLELRLVRRWLRQGPVRYARRLYPSLHRARLLGRVETNHGAPAFDPSRARPRQVHGSSCDPRCRRVDLYAIYSPPRTLAADVSSVRQTLLRVSKRISPSAHHDQMFRMNAWAAERVWNRVTVNLREWHLAQRTPASSSVRLSPTFARTVSAVSRARRMQ
jgi:hypothetical protein